MLPRQVSAQDLGKVQYIEVLLANGTESLTTDQAIAAINSRDALFRTAWPSLTAENPQQAFYLLPLRAAGDFLAYLNANPQLARARQTRTATSNVRV